MTAPRTLAPALAPSALAALVALLAPTACGVKAPPTPILEGFEPRYASEVERRRAEATPAATPTATPTRGSSPGSAPGGPASPAGSRRGNGTGDGGAPAGAPREWNDPGLWPTPRTESPGAAETFRKPPRGPKPPRIPAEPGPEAIGPAVVGNAPADRVATPTPSPAPARPTPR